jgi:hypothetical protein
VVVEKNVWITERFFDNHYMLDIFFSVSPMRAMVPLRALIPLRAMIPLLALIPMLA